MLPEIVIHHLEQARAVLQIAGAAGRQVQLRSAPDAAAYAGVGYLQALGEALDHELLIDCHDDPGLVMAALRNGCRKLAFSGSADHYRRLAEMAVQVDAEIRHEPAPFAARRLILSPDDNGDDRVGDWLSARSKDG
jgi:hypothetical protein